MTPNDVIYLKGSGGRERNPHVSRSFVVGHISGFALDLYCASLLTSSRLIDESPTHDASVVIRPKDSGLVPGHGINEGTFYG